MPAARSRFGAMLGPILLTLVACSSTEEPSGAGEAVPTSTAAEVRSADEVRDLVMPTPDTVGLPDGIELAELDPRDVENGATYRSVRVDGDLDIGPGEAIRFEDCMIEGSIVTQAPVELVRCDVVGGGLYPTDVGGLLRDVLIDSPNGQAFRPAVAEMSGWDRSTPWLLEDVYLRVPPGAEGGHVEAAQILGGRDFVIRNTVFDTGCPFNNTQTADLSMNAAESLIEDSWFIGCGGFAIYSDGPGVRFVRPRFGTRHEWGTLYTDPSSDRIDPEIVDPLDLDGQAVER